MDEDGHVWCAEAGDTLWGLASKEQYGGRGINWKCLWPTNDTKDHGYPNTIHPGDKYDASNLATPAPGATSYKVAVADDVLRGLRSVFGDIPYLRADHVADRIKNISGQGATPISYLLVAGHSGGHGMAGYKEKKGEKTWFRFRTEDLVRMDKPASFARAQLKQGPVVCWFSRDATAVFAGCNSARAMAKPFADQILRVGATASGTNQLVGFLRGQLLWDFGGIDLSGNRRWGSRGTWTTAPVWEQHKGVN